MTLFIFAVVLGSAMMLFLLSFLIDKKKLRRDAVLKGFTGISDWRTRLNGLTDRFVALGADPLLARAASKSNDPAASRLSGQTLTLYMQLKDHFISLSYAYNCGSRAVQQAEAIFRPKGALKLINIRKAVKLSEQGLTIREINPERYSSFVEAPKYGPKPPAYKLEYVLSVCEKLAGEIKNGLIKIAEAPGFVANRLAAADKNLQAAQGQHDSLAASGFAYQPYQSRLDVISAARSTVTDSLASDPLGALAACNYLDKTIQALSQELEQVRQQMAVTTSAAQQFSEVRNWVVKVRATPVNCPWSDDQGQPACWSLSSPESNPDKLLANAEAYLASAEKSLESGNLPAIAGQLKEAQRASGEATKMVYSMLNAKTSVDEQVPRVRAELVTIKAELIGITGGDSNHEMAQLVERTCTAVESRIGDVRKLCQQQRYPEALTLITGTAGSEYGMPVTKLVEQGKELLQLLKKAAQLANSLKAQTA